jgi:glycosyltransferase involved in cell wall biosynthesis
VRRAKIIHDDLNAGGGSERLALATIELLNEMKFDVDLATLHTPNPEEAKRVFGGGQSSLWKFNQIELLDMSSMLELGGENGKKMKANDVSIRTDAALTETNSLHNDQNYDLIINTHADLIPYYNGRIKKMESSKESENDVRRINTTVKITYCHYPLVPQYVQQKNYSFLEKLFDSFNELPEEKKQTVANKILEKYDKMMKNTFILTNSKFSKQEIKRMYKNDNLVPTIIYPPVEINKFKILNSSNSSKRNYNSILVISRISPPKKIENAIEIGKVLREEEGLDYYEMTIVGNITPDDEAYLEKLDNLVSKYNLRDNIKIRTDVSIEELQKRMQNSSIYLHPTPNEPFGISIVEAMSAGLIPVVPKGGDAEFAPSDYRYRSTEHAAQITAGIIKNNNKNDLANERIKISNSTNIFSKQHYKESLKYLIQTLLEKR